MRYCETYQEGDCCQRLPCRRPFDPMQGNLYFSQKSHDLRFTDPRELGGRYIIQFRSPIPRMQSNFEMALRFAAPPPADTPSAFAVHAERETRYFMAFYDKWLRHLRAQDLAISYESLVEHPAAALAGVIRFIQGHDHVEADRLDRAIALVPEKVNAVNAPVDLRNPRYYRHFNENLYVSIEKTIEAHCGRELIPYWFI